MVVTATMKINFFARSHFCMEERTTVGMYRRTCRYKGDRQLALSRGNLWYEINQPPNPQANLFDDMCTGSLPVASHITWHTPIYLVKLGQPPSLSIL